MMPKLLALALVLCAPLAAAADAPMHIPDVKVVDQAGQSHNFYADLVKDRIVAVNFVFTSCTTICPVMGATFAQVQKLLGKRDDVALISITIDPRNDTPARLAAWGKKVGAKPGWTLVTGDPNDIDSLLKAMGVFTPDKNDHGPIVVVGDDRTATWQRISGFAAPGAIAAELRKLNAARGQSSR
jgi:protein SCO1/2